MQLLDGRAAAPPPINVLDSLDEGLCAVDLNLRITYLNASAERICKNRRGGLIGRRLKEAGPEFAGDELLQALQLSLGDGQIRRIDLTTSPAAGWIKVDIQPQRDALWLIMRDPSSRQVIEQQLRDRDEILTMAEQSAGIGVWDIDLATQTVRGTPQFWRVMGLPPTEKAMPIETTRQ